MIGRGKISKPIPIKWKTELNIELGENDNIINLSYELDDDFVQKLRKAAEDRKSVHVEFSFEYYE